MSSNLIAMADRGTRASVDLISAAHKHEQNLKLMPVMQAMAEKAYLHITNPQS
jgi:hypothetical protein